MRNYEVGLAKKMYFLHLGKGEKVLESIEKVCEENNIREGAVLSGIGSASRISYHRIANTNDLPTNEFLTLDGPTEICSLQGLIIEGVPHVHIACCDREKAFGGHLEHDTTVQYLAEICIIDTGDDTLTRRVDEFGIQYIDRK